MNACDPYSAEVRQRFSAPVCAGVAAGTRAQVDAQGVRIALSARVEDGITVECRFLAWGCPHLLAACDYWCEAQEGQGVRELARFPAAKMMAKLGIPVEKTGRILVLEDTVRLLAGRLGVSVDDQCSV